MTKPNKLTPGSNLMWESSRMMLPEHKERHVEHRRDLKVRNRIDLDEQAWGEINMAFADSMEGRSPITVQVYGRYEPLVVTGVIEDVSLNRGEFCINGKWFRFEDIEGVIDYTE